MNTVEHTSQGCGYVIFKGVSTEKIVYNKHYIELTSIFKIIESKKQLKNTSLLWF